MCNHYRNRPDLLPTWREYAGFDARGVNEAWADDVWPKSAAIVAVRSEAGKLAPRVMNWQFKRMVPGKRIGADGKPILVQSWNGNIRNLASPYWRAMLATPAQRCLVPFSSFAEPKKGQGRAEWWFSVVDQPTAAFAGLWRNTEDGIRFAFLTCEPNELVAPLHPKAMPVILDPADYDQWLDGTADEARALARPFPADRMVVE